MHERSPTTNEENNLLYGVKTVYTCKQSSNTLFGECYGYSIAWGLLGDTVLLTAKKNLSEAVLVQDNNECIELPLTGVVSDNQFGQFVTFHADRHLKFYIFTHGLLNLIDKAIKNLPKGNTIIINAAMSLGGHALAIKKINNNEIAFFDCNKGRFEAPNLKTFKQWLPNYLRINYSDAFYAFSFDEVKSNKKDVSVVKNLFVLPLLFLSRLFTFPLGIPGVIRFVGHLCSNALQKFHSSETNDVKTIPSQPITDSYQLFHNEGILTPDEKLSISHNSMETASRTDLIIKEIAEAKDIKDDERTPLIKP